MTNPVHKLADGIRSLMNKGKDNDPYLETDDLFADDPEPEVEEKPSEPFIPASDLMTEEPPKKKRFRLPGFHRDKGSEPSAKKPSEGVSRKQKRILFGCTLLLVAGGFTYAIFFMDDIPESNPAQPPAVAATTQQKPKADGKNAAQQPGQAGAPVAPVVNPFVDLTLLKKSGVNADGTLPTIANAAPVPASSLPSIPRESYAPSYNENPRPSLPAIPSMGSLPAVPNAQAPQSAPAPAARPNEVQGVITGEDGQNMAIMGDGTIVSEGETYNDGRIAYIGGDGIKFDDGSSLDYK